MFSPLNWLLIFLICTLFIKKRFWKRFFGWTAFIVFIVFSNPFLFNLYARWWQPVPVQLSQNAHYSVGIVAGGFASVDMNGGGYFNGASDRFLQAVKLYHTGTIDRILIAGGNSRKNDQSFREAGWAKNEMMEMGVPNSVILIEDRSKDTKGNALFSKKMLDSIGSKPPYVLITSAFHLPRAKKIFESEGLRVIGYPCNYTEGRGPLSAKDFLPDPGVLSAWGKYIKETLWWIVKG